MNIHHRYFVQYMLKNGLSPLTNALDYCKHITQGKVDNMTQLKTLVIEINREISKQFYKIAFTICEVTNQNIVIWLNTKNDNISKFQLSYSVIELEYFQAVLQEILNSDDNRITFIVCINITSTLTSHFSRDSGQKVLNKWIKGGYYVKRGDYIHLGPRTIMEFTAYLRSICPESICNLCSEIVFTGNKCSSCNKTLHSHCLSTYLSHQNVCPCCQNDWVHESQENMNTNNETIVNGSVSTDEEATENDTQSSMSQVIASSISRRSQRGRVIEEDFSDPDEPGPSSRKRNR